ncbi:protein of unknown function [Escherichia coli]|nr:protein of unknown function [Escherichia coli]
MKERIVIQEVLEASDIPYRHDRQLLHSALEKALQALLTRSRKNIPASSSCHDAAINSSRN